jgi:hypothetical protein
MAVLKKTLFAENLENYSVLLQDTDTNSKYFKITELPGVFTGGKNAFLIQGSEFLVADTIIKIEIKDSKGNVIYHEPGEGIPEYYEGTSKVIAVYIYPDTAFGPCTITILGELKEYEDSNGLKQPIPLQYKDTYNVRWQGTVNVNPLLVNTTKIRFYRRPKIEITEQVLPVYNRIVNNQTVSGNVSGVPILPISGSDYKTYKGILQYQLQLDGSENFSQSMEGATMSINVDGTYYTPTITDVISDKKAFVNIPYYVTSSLSPNYQSVTGFKNKAFSITYENSEVLSNSNVSSSFAVIKITDLESFSGDPARIKVYASSRQDLGDYQLLEDIQLESSEILLEREFNNQLNVRTGIFTQDVLNTFWTSNSIETTPNITIDNSLLIKSVKLEPQTDGSSSVGLFSFEYATPFEFNKNTEYQLDFTPLLSSSVSGYGDLELYLSGSAFVNTHNLFGKEIYNEETRTSFRRYEKKQINFKPDTDGTGTLKFIVNGGTWHLANISLRAAHESAFAPNETTLIADVPTKINNETFDFRFEIYDINNNYVPVTIQQTHTFTGGNDIRIKRDLEVNTSFNQFNFSTSSAFPASILIDYIKTGLTGSVTFLSQAIDTTGLGITSGDVTIGSNYPGLLTNVDVDTVELPIESFTGSLTGGKTVGAIIYTASCENINRYFTIYRVEQGAPSYLFYATADKNNFTFDPDDNYKSVIPNDYIDIRLVQQNLPAAAPLSLQIESGSELGTPAPLYYTGSIGNASIYRLFVSTSADTTPDNKSGYTYQIGQSHYDFRLNTVDGIFTSSVIIDAIQKGDKGKGLVATSDRNQFFYKMTDLSPTPSSQTATILVKRQNLGSLSNTITYTKTGSGPNLTLVSQNIGNGVAQFTVDTSAYTYGMGETKYVFQATDLNGVIYYDEISLAAVIAESQISVNLTNENATLPALSNGFVASGSFILTSGSVSVKVGSEDITREEGLSTNNRFDIISATAVGCVANDSTPDDATYGITSLTSDSGSLSLLIQYKDGRGSTTNITKVVTYTKAKKAAPSLEIVASPKDQSVTAKSTGEQIDSLSNVTVAVRENYDGNTSNKTITSLTAVRNDTSANLTTNPSTGLITLSGQTLGNAVNSTTVAISASVTDSEGTTRTITNTLSISKVKKSVPNVILNANPQTQAISATSQSVQTGDLSIVSLDAFEGTTSVFNSASIISANFTGASISGTSKILTLGTIPNGVPAASASISINYTNSEGATANGTINVSAVKSVAGLNGATGSNGASGSDGSNAVNVQINPTSQNIIRSNTGTYASALPFTVLVTETGSLLTYVSGNPTLTNGQFKITNVYSASGITNNDNGASNIITPIQPTTTAPYNTTFNLTYKDSKGNQSVAIPLSHSVAITLDGQTGPGVVHTGIWEVGRAYQFSTGAGTGRRDVVLWSTNGSAPYDTYYAAIRQHTSEAGNVINGAPHQPTQTGWESLGTQDFFVAAKIGLFEDSYVQSTLNVGTNNNGGVSSANITLAGGSANPYMSIGQSSTIGSQGYGLNGIFLGLDSSTAKFSLVNGTTSFLKWTGTGLEIKGSITVTGGDAATQTFANNVGSNAVASGSASAASAQAAAQLFATGVGNNAVLSGSAAASTAQTNATNSALAFASGAVNLLANGNWVGGSGTFITSTSISSPIIAANAGYISGIFKVGQNGITLNGIDKKIYIGTGDFNNANTAFYVDNSNNFSLGNKLSWNGTTLSLEGSINITGGTAATSISNLNSATSSLNSTTTNLQGQLGTVATATGSLQGQLSSIGGVSSSWVNPSSYAFGPAGDNGFDLASISPGSTAGLYIGSTHLGYHNGTSWKTYMQNNGNFFLAGSGNNGLTWNGATLSIDGDITARNGTFIGNITSTATISGGTISGGTISGGNISIGTGNNIFKADSNGIYLGNATFASAPFRVTPAGALTAANVTISGGSIQIGTKFSVDSQGNLSANNAALTGSIVATSGKIGNWIITDGKLTNDQGSIEIDADGRAIIIYSGSDPKLTISGQTELTNPALGTIFSGPHPGVGGSMNADTTAYGQQVGVEDAVTTSWYGSISLASGPATIEYYGGAIDMSSNSMPLGNGNFVNSEPRSGVAGEYIVVVHLDFKNTTTNNIYSAAVQTGQYTGTYTSWDEAGQQWITNAYSYINSSSGLRNLIISIGETGTYQWRLRVATYASAAANVNSDGSYAYLSTSCVSSISSFADYLNVEPTSNIVELTNRGFQILNNPDNYVQIKRYDSSGVWNSQPLINVQGGQGIRSYGVNPGSGNDYGVCLDLKGRIDLADVQNGGFYAMFPNASYITSNGNSSKLWTSVWAQNGTIQTSDRNQKKNIENSELGLQFINDLRPVKYKFIKNTSDRTHYGLIAQDVTSSLDKFNIDKKDFAGFISYNNYVSGSSEITEEAFSKIENEDDKMGWDKVEKYSLRYDEFISPMIKAIQELTKKVEELEAKISGSI